MKELFIKFLKKHGVLRKFKVNVKADGSEYQIEKYLTDGNFMSAFIWSKTSEGINYWSNLHNEWIEKVEKTK